MVSAFNFTELTVRFRQIRTSMKVYRKGLLRFFTLVYGGNISRFGDMGHLMTAGY